jgi:molecular chaperone GrpE
MAFKFDFYAPSMAKTCQFGCKTGIGKMFVNCTFAKMSIKNPYFQQIANKFKRKIMQAQTNTTDDLKNETTTMVDELNINSDSDIPGNTHLSNPDQLDVADKLQQELDEQKDKYIRLFAEFDNYKRRSAKERIELIQTAGKEVITSLLDVLDDCDRAEKQLQKSDDIEQIKEGVQLVFGKLRNTLQAKGVKAMESIGTDFDVEKHEAITEIPAPTEALKDKIVDEVTKGYYLNDKLIRFAKVVLGK